ncbi:calcium-binding protein, partial [Komagataeibacter swingsii]|uniref:calcium-binding protein n=3 Tax=Komagataeibacter swingsii TaxID=215220 RepID=UPI0038CFE8D9
GGASDTIYGNGNLLADSVSDSTIQGHAKLTVEGGASDTIYGKGNLLADSVSDSTIQAQAKLTVSGGSNDTISASHSTRLDDVDASTISVSVHGSLTFIDGSNGISDTVTGSYATIYGTAGLDLTANIGATTTYYASSGNETLDGGLSTGKLYARAGSGNDTLIGGSGYDTLRAGTGDDLFVAGSAQTEFEFIKGKAGGNDIIQDFGKSAGNVVKLSGYDAKTSSIQAMLDNATIAGGNTTVSLTDNTRITFVGVTDLKVQNFKS